MLIVNNIRNKYIIIIKIHGQKIWKLAIPALYLHTLSTLWKTVLYFHNGSPLRLVSVDFRGIVFETPENVEHSPDLLLEMQMKAVRFCPVVEESLPVYHRASLKMERGNYRYVLLW